MSNAQYMGVSPSQGSGQTGNNSSLKQSTSEEACEFGAGYTHNEQLESKHLPGNEKLPAFCGDVPDKSFTEHSVLPREDVSKSSQTNNTSCSQQNTSERKHEIGSECEHSEKSERKHWLDFHIVGDEPKEISLVMFSSVDNDKLQPVSQDVRKCSQINSKNTREFCSVNGCIELDAGCVCRETSEQNYHLGSEIIHNEPANPDAGIPSGVLLENLQTTSEDMTKIIPTESLQPLRDVNNGFQTGEKSCPQQSTCEQTLEVTTGIASHEPLEVNNKLDFQLVQNSPMEIGTATSCYISTGQLGSPPELVIKGSPIEHLKQPEVPIITPISKCLVPYSGDITKISRLEQPEAPSKYAVNNSSRSLGLKGKKASKALKKKYMLRSSRGSDRVLRSTSGGKSKSLESSNRLADVSSIRGRKRKKQKSRRGTIVTDEYSRIRTHLRYLVNRIKYEQSLIAAYSSEGWKGLSIEKLKPEKELQRATSEILRRKLKIRDLFQRLDSLCAEGGFPKSLFDSEGQIDSEDIFCAKCGSKELSAYNDIILCDGACDRGFHQYCLEPPLLEEDIPPDDEGWLCPGCDCKVDCIDLVNESQGTNLFITDKWENVFPEAAAAAGHNQDPHFGLPSDDSDDNDYDPDGPEDPAIDEKDQGDESSSGESDFTSTSDDLEALADDKEDLGLPSDDSEDDEYNPDAPEPDEKTKSSGSDFTSDSEDLAAVVKDSGSSGNEEGAISVSPLRDSNGKRSKLGGSKESLNNELLSILESGKDGAAPVYGKRSIERLDYKKLYDETYGHVPSDSSDDEDWIENDGPMKRTKGTREGFSASPNGNAPGTGSGKNTKVTKKNLKETEHIPKRRGRRKLNSEDTNVSHEGSSTPGSAKRARSSYKRLGEDVTQELYKSFKENQYPDRSKKESLAKELGITFSQISKWFENTRWSFNHSSSMDARMGTIASEKTSCRPQSNNRSVRRVSACNVTENGESPKTVDDMGHSSGDVKDSELVTEERSRRKPTTAISRKRKRKGKTEHQASCTDSKIEVIHGLAAGSPKVQETQTNGRTQRRRNHGA